MESMVATSPMKMVANGEEQVITLTNPNHGNDPYNGRHFSRDDLAMPSPSIATGISWYDNNPRVHCDIPGVMEPSQSLMMTVPYPTYPYSHGQVLQQQQRVLPERHHPLLNSHRSAFSPPIAEESMNYGRTKRARSKSLDTSEVCAVDQGLECDDESIDSIDAPLPEKRRNSSYLTQRGFSDNDIDEANYFRRFSSRQRKRPSFYGVSKGREGVHGDNDERECRSIGSKSGGVVKDKRVKITGDGIRSVKGSFENERVSKTPTLIKPSTESRRLFNTPPSALGSAEGSNENGNLCESPSIIDSTKISNGDGHLFKTQGSASLDDKPAAQSSAGKKETPNGSCDTSVSSLYGGELKKVFCINRFVWGKLPGYSWWPGAIISYDSKTVEKETKEKTPAGKQQNKESPSLQEGSEVTSVWVKWFGENQLSLVSMDKLALIEEFEKYYSPTHMKGTYKKAIVAVLKEAARRCSTTFSSDPNDKELRWVVVENSSHVIAANESPVVGTLSETGTSAETNGSALNGDNKNGEEDKNKIVEMEDCEDPLKANTNHNNNSQMTTGIQNSSNGSDGNYCAVKAAPRSAKKGKTNRELFLTSYEKELLEWALRGFLPHGPLGGLIPTEQEQAEDTKVVEGEKTVSVFVMNDSNKKAMKNNKGNFDMVREGKLKIEEICISCGSKEVVANHPLFHGGMCKPCKNGFKECVYLFDDDGSQMYCAICSAGDEVFICDANNCCKVICQPCIERLCGAEEVKRVRESSTWQCYLCSDTHSQVGLLAKRDDWDVLLTELFMNDHEMEFEPFPVFPPIAPELRKPMRVLSLFDGIATGHYVLTELGLEIENYVSSEVDMDAITVSRIHHPRTIHVGDVRCITEKEVKAWGPFDLVMGGSPCNDLSRVNPARKGIYGGSGKLFFEFFRILSIAKPAPDENRPFFWLFENVTSMETEDRQVICRFLKCNPVPVDAKMVSAANRPRYFWGNLPGMTRPIVALPSDRLSLQECLEPNCFRLAQVVKVNTITTKTNSIKQRGDRFPVLVKGYEEKGDIIWNTEMERVFGLPPHYTDVNNLSRQGRQRLLGKSWSVPVIRHLLSPLKDYFMTSKTKEVKPEDN